jgi:hypothetical protein
MATSEYNVIDGNEEFGNSTSNVMKSNDQTNNLISTIECKEEHASYNIPLADDTLNLNCTIKKEDISCSIPLADDTNDSSKSDVPIVREPSTVLDTMLSDDALYVPNEMVDPCDRLQATETSTAEAVATNNNHNQNNRPWDYSNRKVIVQGIDKFHDVKTATKMLHKWFELHPIPNTTAITSASSFAIDKIKKPPKSTWMIITLHRETMVQPFIDYINTSSIKSRKGNNVFAKLQLSQTENMDDDIGNGDRTSRRRNRRDGNEDDDDCNNRECDKNQDVDETKLNHINNRSNDKRRRVNNDETISIARRPITMEELKNQIIPLWNLSTEEQLQNKMKEMIKKCAMKIIVEIKQKFRYVNICIFNIFVEIFFSC